MQPLLESDRDKRTWSWICVQVGEAAALGALDGLPGNRRPYPSNAAKILGLVVPADVVETPLSGGVSPNRRKFRHAKSEPAVDTRKISLFWSRSALGRFAALQVSRQYDSRVP